MSALGRVVTDLLFHSLILLSFFSFSLQPSTSKVLLAAFVSLTGPALACWISKVRWEHFSMLLTGCVTQLIQHMEVPDELSNTPLKLQRVHLPHVSNVYKHSSHGLHARPSDHCFTPDNILSDPVSICIPPAYVSASMITGRCTRAGYQAGHSQWPSKS